MQNLIHKIYFEDSLIKLIYFIIMKNIPIYFCVKKIKKQRKLYIYNTKSLFKNV